MSSNGGLLSLADLSLSVRGRPRLMGILRAYADESGKAGAAHGISMGSVIGRDDQWANFNKRWPKMLAAHGIPYLHMKEVMGARFTKIGPFAQFLDIQKLDRLMIDASDCIVKSGLYCFANAVYTDDLKRVMKRHRLNVDPYSFMLCFNVVMLGTWALNNYPADPSFHLVLDRLEKGYARVAEAERMYESDTFCSWRGWPAVTPLKQNDRVGSRQMMELQAADLVAWSLRNELVNIREWMRDVKPTLGAREFSEWSKSLREWLSGKLAEQSVTYPERRAFFRPFARLADEQRLHHYFLDEERLEDQIIQGRVTQVNPLAMADAIKQAGRAFPLSP
ncbi:MAG: hypothetical protein ABIR08_07095 [Sphingomonas sp.]